MAHESFEDTEVAQILNDYFVSVKVDKEERPDIDSIYMNVSMVVNGSGGWPLTVVMDCEGKPFFVGTYFPKRRKYGQLGLIELLEVIREKWNENKEELLDSAEKIIKHINDRGSDIPKNQVDTEQLIYGGIAYFKSAFDSKYGGFGHAPKFPSAHNLIFLMEASKNLHEKNCLAMVEKTLLSMAKGGIFDHIGFGFSRYSTDEKWLAPHFEKMLYDNAMLIMTYIKAYEMTKNPIYKDVAEKTCIYIEREMTHPDGGFYSAQDADSDGIEGKYYVFTKEEILQILGETDGQNFCKLYDITKTGNFEGKNIPNQIHNKEPENSMSQFFPKLYDYRKMRTKLHMDDKILTSWNAMIIVALAEASVAFKCDAYLKSAKKAIHFIEENLFENDRIFTSFCEGKRTGSGVLDDYAFYIYALLKVYYISPEKLYLERVDTLMKKVIEDFFDHQNGGFFFTGNNSERLISRPKETYDGAIPSGNSIMTMNLVILSLLSFRYDDILEEQITFMKAKAADMPFGHSFFLYSLLKKDFPDAKIVIVPDSPAFDVTSLGGKGWVKKLEHETEEYKLKDGKTTFYVCENGICHPPHNSFPR